MWSMRCKSPKHSNELSNWIKGKAITTASCFIFALLMFGCAKKLTDKHIPVSEDTVNVDSLYIHQVDSLIEVLQLTRDSLNAYKADTTISAELFEAKYKLERIRYYTNLVDKKSSQMTFYKGWIKRVLND